MLNEVVASEHLFLERGCKQVQRLLALFGTVLLIND